MNSWAMKHTAVAEDSKDVNHHALSNMFFFKPLASKAQSEQMTFRCSGAMFHFNPGPAQARFSSQELHYAMG